MPTELHTIIKKSQEGDHAAFAILVREHQQYAYSLAFRILCDDEEAKDAVQESFIKIWNKIAEFDIKKRFTTWMYSIVTNCAIDRFRARKRRNFVQLNDVPEDIFEMAEANLNKKLENKEIGEIIRFIADDLPEKQRLVFVLRDLQGLDSVETQEILNESETFVKSNLYMARKSVRQKLEKIMAYERR